MTPARILIVEDERITAEDLRDILTQLGHTVTGVASSGAEAIAQVERTAPDLVLMDIRIKGDLDGTETARILRERFDTAVVFLTAHSDEETLSRARLAAPLGYVIKPFQESELRATIEMALHKDRADRILKEKHDRLSATLDAMGEAVVCSSADGVVTYMNPASEAWTGWKRPEAVGRPLDEVVPLTAGDGRRSLEQFVAQVLGEGVLAELGKDAVVVSRDGVAWPVGGSLAPIRDHTGRISGAVLVFGQARDEGQRPAAGPQPVAGQPAEPGRLDMIGESDALRQLLKFAARIAASEASTILLEGESGTGKDVLAKFIHQNSRRQTEPFLAVNCAAIPETLLESELFGYEKGAFTDARAQKKGILELANLGTVFLDEVGELPLALQAKLLRVLEEQSFRRLGGLKDIQVDVRVIAATNRDLRTALEQGRFRLDLYYRLNVIQLTISPLRERRDDILPLARYFIGLYNRKFGRQVQGIAPEAVPTLLAHDWPGNVRELRNTIERAMVLEDGPWLQRASLAIKLESAQADMSQPAVTGEMSLEQVEKAMLVRALEKTGGNQTRAARLLKITRDTLRYKMKKFHLGSPPRVG